MVCLCPIGLTLKKRELRHIAVADKDLRVFSDTFYLRTISLINDLGPDFQSKFSGFIITEKERQREREQDHEQLRIKALLGKLSEP